MSDSVFYSLIVVARLNVFHYLTWLCGFYINYSAKGCDYPLPARMIFGLANVPIRKSRNKSLKSVYIKLKIIIKGFK